MHTEYAERKGQDATTIKMWVEEHKQQHKDKKANECREDADYSEQTMAILRMRGLCEDENSKKRADANKCLQQANQKLAQEKRDRESAWANDQQSMNLKEITVHKDMDLTHTKQYLSHAK